MAVGIDDLNINTCRQTILSSYDQIRGIEAEPSIWENFNPIALTTAVLFSLLWTSKEFKSIAMDPTLKGSELRYNKANMIQLNGLNAYLDKINIKKIPGTAVKDPFLSSELISLKNDIKTAQLEGRLAKDSLKSLNKRYYSLIDKNLKWHTSFIEKGLAKLAIKNPSICGELFKSYKNNKFMMLFEACYEIPNVLRAFQKDTETGMKQLAQSAGKAAAGYGGFAAGAALGGKLGALIGSIIPGAGTLAGGIIGSAIGFTVGGFCSQLTKNVYEKIFPSEISKQRDTDIAKILDKDDTTPEVKEILEKELNQYKEYLSEAGKVEQKSKEELAAAISANDKKQEKEAREVLAELEENNKPILESYEILTNIYQSKFGGSMIAENQTEEYNKTAEGSSEINNVNTAAAQTPAAVLQAQYNNAAAAQYFMSSAAMDWSRLLSSDAQQNLFAAA